MEPIYFFRRYQRGSNPHDYQWVPQPLPTGVLGAGFEALAGWDHLDCGHEYGYGSNEHYLYKPTVQRYHHKNSGEWDHELSVTSPSWIHGNGGDTTSNRTDDRCKSTHHVGDRILTIVNRGADRVTAVGLQNGDWRNGTSARLDRYVLQYQSSFCSNSVSQIHYVELADDAHEDSVQSVFHLINGEMNTPALRVLSFVAIGVPQRMSPTTRPRATVIYAQFHGRGMPRHWVHAPPVAIVCAVLAILGHTIILRRMGVVASQKSHLGAAASQKSYQTALRALSCPALFGYVVCMAVVVWIVPVILCWAGTFPNKFLRLVAVLLVAGGIARFLLHCSLRLATEKAAEAQRTSASSKQGEGDAASSSPGPARSSAPPRNENLALV